MSQEECRFLGRLLVLQFGNIEGCLHYVVGLNEVA